MRVALTFPGQGSQRPGMGEAWRVTPGWSLVRDSSEALGIDLERLLLEADAEELRQSREAQVSTHLVSLLALDALRPVLTSAGADVVAVAGHSLGEYTALVAAGVLDVASAVRLVGARGEAMSAAARERPGTMAAVLGLDDAGVEAACASVEGAWLANLNAPGNVVVSGTAEGVAAAGEAARERGAKRVMPIPVGGAFHSPLMEPALPALRAALDAAPWATAHTPVWSNVDAAPHENGWAERLAAQLLSPVRWTATLAGLAAAEVDVLLEVGPGGVLTGLARRGAPGTTAASVATPDDLEKLGAVL